MDQNINIYIFIIIKLKKFLNEIVSFNEIHGPLPHNYLLYLLMELLVARLWQDLVPILFLLFTYINISAEESYSQR